MAIFRSRSALVALLVVFTMAISTQAIGADWKPYFENKGGVRFSIDTSSLVKVAPNIVRGWEKQEFDKEVPGIGIGHLWLIQVDCRLRVFEFKEIRPIKSTPALLLQIPDMMQMYAGSNYFGPNDLDEARYSAFCTTKH